jgi:hypothetical protein
LLASYFGAMISFNPKVGARFWLGPTQENSIFPMPFYNPIFTYTLFSMNNLLEVFKPLFHLQLDVVHFMWLLAPLKERWYFRHVLCLFFVGLVWNSSWACSMSDSFTQDAFIGWYPFHLTKYSYSRPLNCLDLNMASTSNSSFLWTKSSGGLELCSRLGLEALQEIVFKRDTWNVGWTIRFFGSFNL